MEHGRHVLTGNKRGQLGNVTFPVHQQQQTSQQGGQSQAAVLDFLATEIGLGKDGR